MAVVYIDEIFMINCIINFILLSVTRRIICIRSSKIMLYVGAVIGGLYAVLVFVPQLEFLYTLYGKFIFSLALVGITYGIKRIKEFLKAVAVFYLISFAFGGAAYGLISLLRIKGNALPFLVLLFSTATAYGLITLFSWHRRTKLQKEEQMVGMRILSGGKDVIINCLVDTGNALYEPITKRPVIVAQSDQLKPILPDGFCLATAIERPETLPLKLRMIPFRSLGQERGMILGFVPDMVWLLQAEQQIPVPNAVIGIYEGQLSSDNRYGGLLNPVLLKSIELSCLGG